MRFVADMGISPRTVSYLRVLGHDAVHLYEEGLDRLSDSDILAKARDESRIVLTHDLDFGELMAISGSALPSVVTFRLRDMRPDKVNQHLRAIVEQHYEALQSGAMITVTDRRVRVRRLPIERDAG